jgi:hypothetical protein
LAPHGVPSNPIPRALSSSRLNEMGVNNQAGEYGATYQTTGGALDVPGGAPRNPFQQAAAAPAGNNPYGGGQY